MSPAANPVDPAVLAASAASAAGRGRILVVDDDRLVLAMVVHGLTAAGYDVIDADNGDDAILLARQHRPQLALLDIRMEGKSGFDVAETLRDAYGIPFMFLSAFADPDTLARVQSLGAQAYLVKPLDVGQIVPSVEAVLARLAGQQGAARGGAMAGRELAPAAAAAPDVAAAAAPDVAAAAAPGPLADPVALAVGVLMHRHSLARAAALERLQQLARDGGRTLAAQSERLLAAVEELALTAR